MRKVLFEDEADVGVSWGRWRAVEDVAEILGVEYEEGLPVGLPAIKSFLTAC